MITKLYKRTPDGLLYWSAWNQRRTITIHEGRVGDRGSTRELTLGILQRAGPAIRDLAKSPLADGYAPIPLEEHDQIIVQLRSPDPPGKEFMEEARSLSALLNDEIGWLGGGQLDGYDIGGGTTNIFLDTIDPEAVTPGIIAALACEGLADRAVVAVGRRCKSTEGVDDIKITVVHPHDHDRPFEY